MVNVQKYFRQSLFGSLSKLNFFVLYCWHFALCNVVTLVVPDTLGTYFRNKIKEDRMIVVVKYRLRCHASFGVLKGITLNDWNKSLEIFAVIWHRWAWNSFHLIIRVRYCENIFYRDDNRDNKSCLKCFPFIFQNVILL